MYSKDFNDATFGYNCYVQKKGTAKKVKEEMQIRVRRKERKT